MWSRVASRVSLIATGFMLYTHRERFRNTSVMSATTLTTIISRVAIQFVAKILAVKVNEFRKEGM